MLAVVEQEQGSTGFKCLHQFLGQRALARLVDADDSRHRQLDQARIGEGRQFDKAHPIPERVMQLAGKAQRQACLAYSAGTVQRRQAFLTEQNA